MPPAHRSTLNPLKYATAAIAALFVLGSFLAASPAGAQEARETPADGASVTSVAELELRFDKAVNPATVTIEVDGPSPVTVTAEAGAFTEHVQVDLPSPLEPGTWTARWSAVDAAGETLGGTWSFTVLAPGEQPPASTPPQGEPEEPATGDAESAEAVDTPATTRAATGQQPAGTSALSGGQLVILAGTPIVLLVLAIGLAILRARLRK